MRLRSVCWLALPPFAGGAFGAMPTYRRKRPFRRSHLPFATPGGRDLKYHPYTPGARGTGPGFARHSELLNRFADFRNSAPSTGSIGILKLADQELQCADQVAEDDRAALGTRQLCQSDRDFLRRAIHARDPSLIQSRAAVSSLKSPPMRSVRPSGQVTRM